MLPLTNRRWRALLRLPYDGILQASGSRPPTAMHAAAAAGEQAHLSKMSVGGQDAYDEQDAHAQTAPPCQG